MMKPETRAQIQPKARKFILRPYRRIPTWYVSYYMSGTSVGRGVVMNLSRSGLRMLGDHSVRRGDELSVRLTIEEQSPPLEISRASVRWVTEYEFGLQIESITSGAANRIAGLLHDQARKPRTDL